MRRARPFFGALIASLLLVSAACTTRQPSPRAKPRDSASAGGTVTATPHVRRLRVRQLAWRLPGPLAREAVIKERALHVVVAGGLVGADSSTATAYTLDLRNGRTHALGSLAVPVHDTAGAELGGRELVIGGGNASEQAVVQTRGRNGWLVTGRLPSARSDLSAVVLAGRVLVLGGYDGTSPALADVLAGDGRHWKVVGRLPVPVRYTAVAVSHGAVWLFGGERNGTMVDLVQRVDPGSGHARVVARLPRPLGHASAVPFGGRILVVGGRVSADVATDRMWWFDPGTGRFTRAGRLPTPLADAGLVVDGSSAWLLGGETPAETDRVVELSER